MRIFGNALEYQILLPEGQGLHMQGVPCPAEARAPDTLAAVTNSRVDRLFGGAGSRLDGSVHRNVCF
jgi:hypothetical protein